LGGALRHMRTAIGQLSNGMAGLQMGSRPGEAVAGPPAQVSIAVTSHPVAYGMISCFHMLLFKFMRTPLISPICASLLL
jgi:hypothetical protein